ncbi:metal-dependent hydrolase family protein [Cytobacillus oceanisediminis]|uniref:metal-dependent hydrolase family protein n=1 Tax=Cytobacillus oceanisediminis TaxID=665099 RepID=UPI00207A1F31|nr:amidohydrolase family protein [Cytobacillus oceanisediminis]MBY0155602.1 amidohydrolase family protein [Cytobacillus firmus]USK42314.1 amidohydrolase family protein [Cytobacillus oceanisediminis]
MEFVISNVKLLYGEELECKKGLALLIKDGLIKDIIPESQLPATVKVIDGNGGFLAPGLIDLHIHMMWDGSLNPVQTSETEGHEQMLIRAVANCQTYLHHGITTVRDIGSIDDIALHVAKGIKRGLISGPDVIASGKTLTMTGGHDPFWARFVDGKEEALKGVREQIFKGAEVIKVSSTGGVYGRIEGEQVGNAELSLEEQEVICNEAHRFGLKVASHAIGRDGIHNSILAGVDTIEHGHFLDDELVALMEERNTAWIPTLFVYKQIATQEGIPSYARDKAEEIVSIHRNAFESYFNRNILIGAGSDAGSPCTSHRALLDELYTMYEMIPDAKEVLKTATVNAGKILGHDVGQIKEGYRANLILLKENPLECLSNLESIKMVVIRGKVLMKYTNNNLEMIAE